MPNAADWYTGWRASLALDTIEYGVGGIQLVRPDDVPSAQVGYAVGAKGESFVGDEPGDWRFDWLVIGHETACGDPIFVSTESPHPVFTAMHGEGSWNPELIAPSLDVFRECLAVFRTFAAARGSPVALEQHPPTPQEQTRFLQEIRALTGGAADALGFWAVQIEVNLDEFDI